MCIRDSYWDVDFPRKDERDPKRTEADHIAAVRAALLEAVELRMVADVPVGCYLSGGIDSCSILGLASAVSQAPVKAFTIGFDDARYDESPIAREMAEATGAEQDLMRLSGQELYGHMGTHHLAFGANDLQHPGGGQVLDEPPRQRRGLQGRDDR